MSIKKIFKIQPETFELSKENFIDSISINILATIS